MENFVNKIKELFSSTMLLLNDTNNFLSRTKIFSQYEKDLREWRRELLQNRNNTDIHKKVKNEIIELRKMLRMQGYNLKLGSKDIKIGGFLSDDATIRGFKRLVIFLHNDTIYYLKGDENHINLIKYLGIKLHIENISSYSNIHSLWFRWRYNILEISGADSESQNDFEELKTYINNNKPLVLKKLSQLSEY